ncbi:MAG: trypsin-like peptidase domain-containing protein [Firmicutes bacterium]|nr:trypsin-like peptidase domain-containing protein [Bacillota bacterium]
MQSRWHIAIVAPVAAAAMGFGYALGSRVPAAHTAAPPPQVAPAVRLAAARGSAAPATGQGQVLTANTIPNLVARAEPAVVTIYATIPGQVVQTPFGQQLTPPSSGIGSGFIVSSDGLILTNDHVVAGASSVQVRVNGFSNRFKATVVGTDYGLDLALLKIQAPRALPTLSLASSNAAAPVGSWSIAIGAPEGLYNTVTVGVISAKGRSFTIANRHYDNLLQTDTPINPGNSGGPLLNLNGQVVGINTAVNASGQGLGFAIPIGVAEKAMASMTKQHLVGKGWLGVIVSSVTPSLAQQDGLSVSSGALVVAVEPQSPASSAGFQPGDVIVAAAGKPVASASALTPIIEAGHPGDPMTFEVVRGTRHLSLTAVLETRPTPAA